jgi:antitoxin (DNA-binding transcriptional repressor) of toxin-antitoxin stability system
MGVPNRTKFASRIGGGWSSIQIVDDTTQGAWYFGMALDPNTGEPRVATPAGAPVMHFCERTRGRLRVKIAPTAVPEPPAATLARPEGTNWAVAITARHDGGESEPLFVGAAPVAAGEPNRFSAMRAPDPPTGKMLSLSVAHSEWDRLNGEYVRDFQPAAETMHWAITTDGAEGPGEQTLAFQGFDLPAGLKLQLSDPAAGWTRDVASGESVTIAARGRRVLELVATTSGDGAARTPAEGFAFAYPNPFAKATGLTFALARSGNIAVEIFDLGGRRVRTLSRTGAAPGEHVLVWDGRDGDGRALPSGVYLARYHAGAASGARRLVKVN